MFTFGFVPSVTRTDVMRDSYRVWTERKEGLQKLVKNPVEGDRSLDQMSMWFQKYYGEPFCFRELLAREDAILSQISPENSRKRNESLIEQGRKNADGMAEFLSQKNPWFTKGMGELLLRRFFDVFVLQRLGEADWYDEQTRLSFQIAEEFGNGLVEQLGLVSYC